MPYHHRPCFSRSEMLFWMVRWDIGCFQPADGQLCYDARCLPWWACSSVTYWCPTATIPCTVLALVIWLTWLWHVLHSCIIPAVVLTGRFTLNHSPHRAAFLSRAHWAVYSSPLCLQSGFPWDTFLLMLSHIFSALFFK